MLAIKNFATCFIASAVTVAATSIDVDDASRLPTLQQGDYFYLTLQSFTSRGYVEIVRVTGVSGNTLTVVRGQESTSAKAFSVGDYAEQRFTKATFADFVAQSVAGKADLTGALFTGDVQVATQGQSNASVVRYDTLAVALGSRVLQSDFDDFAAAVNTEFDGVASSINSLGQNKADLSALNSGLALKVDKSAVETTGNLIMRQGGPRDIQIAQALANTTGGAYVSVDAPPNPFLGMRWFCMLDGRTYIWIIDADSSQWVEENPQSPDWITTSSVLSDLATNKNLPSDVTIGGKKPDNGDPVLASRWMRSRASIWSGYAPEDGQLLSRALYPDAWASIQAGAVPVCSDAEWLADPAKRGCFTTGDGATTFRVPDLNGKSDGSLGAVFQRGDGLNSSGASGHIQDSQNKAHGHDFSATTSTGGEHTHTYSQAYKGSRYFDYDGTDVDILFTTGTTSSAGSHNHTVSGTSASVGGTDARPVNVTGCYAVRLFGAVQNTGSADAAALATAVAALAAQVTALEARKFTTLISALYPSGAPHDTHETVDAALPTNLAVNTRYVLTNPFGINVRVAVVAEVWADGKWFEAGWDGNTGTGSLSYGVKASYVQGEGIVIQTGNSGLTATSVSLGGGGGVTSNTTSAPCRVAVRKWEA